MKKNINSDYRQVVFKDLASKFQMICGSTVKTKETIKWKDGKTYPFVEVEVSSGSHPFYTGQEMILDTAGRVEKFEMKRKAAEEKKAQNEKKSEKKEEKIQEIKDIFEGKNDDVLKSNKENKEKLKNEEKVDMSEIAKEPTISTEKTTESSVEEKNTETDSNK